MPRRQKAMLAAGALVAPFTFLDLLLPNGERLAVATALWTAAIFAGAAMQSARRPSVRGLGTSLAALAGVGVAFVNSLQTGHAGSVFYPLFLALPLIVLAIAPDLPALVAATGGASLAGSVAVQVWQGLTPEEVFYSVSLMVAVVALAVVGALLVQRQQQRELEGERERGETLAALAESERRRGEAERFAQVGRLAAAVAHEVNSPLASLAANVRWLNAGDSLDPDERTAAVEETTRSLERITEVLERIREFSLTSESGSGMPAGLDDVLPRTRKDSVDAGAPAASTGLAVAGAPSDP
ncbi:MAG TPA: histidine kinase dimerization/phospho-acceptor domain-containing protein [Anaeromyxobacteraceae bacterium]|nr:histidine kinase dimerization/phospho-acceptor domain-containing protein [Anaeromyxobacteraceae bacterium]